MFTLSVDSWSFRFGHSSSFESRSLRTLILDSFDLRLSKFPIFDPRFLQTSIWSLFELRVSKSSILSVFKLRIPTSSNSPNASKSSHPSSQLQLRPSIQPCHFSHPSTLASAFLSVSLCLTHKFCAKGDKKCTPRGTPGSVQGACRGC